MWKWITPIILVLALFISPMSAAANQFTDVNMYEEEIGYLVENKIINGFPDNTFRPNQNVTRVQMVQLLMRTMQDNQQASFVPNYRDITETTNGYREIARATELGIISGWDGKFHPNVSLTRAQFAKMFVEAFQLEGNEALTFNDVPADHWAGKHISILADNEITTGTGNGNFGPNAYVSRAHTALFFYRYLTQEETEKAAEYKITAQEATMNRTATQQLGVWAYNGEVPGTEIRVKAGQTLKVHFDNELPEATTIHWHGIPLENKMDGVAGITQEAVQPGEGFLYEFAPKYPGTYFYHSHVNSAAQVGKGLYGALIVEERFPSYDRDYVLFFDAFGVNGKIGSYIPTLKVKDGERVRIRMINVNTTTHEVYMNGTDFTVTHTDGMPINQPGMLRNTFIPIASGERYDIEFTADKSKDIFIARSTKGNINSATRVLFEYEDGTTSKGNIPSDADYKTFDLMNYGMHKSAPIHHSTQFDVAFHMDLGVTPDLKYTINDKVFPDEYEPVLVKEGDFVKVSIANPTTEDHPMHLHGHHFYILSKNGSPISGSPVLKDTANIKPGETMEIGFEANNPGIWMFHCHILPHADNGMKTMLMYEGFEPIVDGGHQHHH